MRVLKLNLWGRGVSIKLRSAMWTSAFFLLAAEVAALHPKGYICGRTPSALKIDGRLDDAAWKLAPWTSDFADIEGDKGPKARFRTRAKMLWDDRYLYIAAELEEPRPWATLTAHDAVIFQDHDFEVFLNPGGDRHNYFEFEINALNTSWDLFLPKPYLAGGSADNSWSIGGLKTAVHVNGKLNDARRRSRGWTVEMAFPWDAFAHAGYRARRPQTGEQWRVNFSRVEWQTHVVKGKIEKVPATREDNWVWSPQGKVNMHLPEYWGYVQFEETAGAAFRSDPAWAARQRVQAVYDAQLEFKRKYGRWASSLAELGVDFGVDFEPGWRASSDGVSINAEGRVSVLPLR